MSADRAIKQEDRAARAERQWRESGLDLPDLLPVVVVGRLMEAARRIDRERLMDNMRDAGLGDGEFDVLAALRRSGSVGRLVPSQLSEATLTTTGGMTSRLDRLERSGLIQRVPNPDDRRSLLIELTKKGRDLFDKLFPLHIASAEDALAGLSRKDLKSLSGMLEKLILSL